MDEQVHAPGRLEIGQDLDFRTPVVPDSDIPALLGILSLERLEAIIDCRKSQRKMYLGAGTVVQPSDDTTELQLYPATSGHLMLPITHYDAKPKAKARPQQQTQLHLLKTDQPIDPATGNDDGSKQVRLQ